MRRRTHAAVTALCLASLLWQAALPADARPSPPDERSIKVVQAAATIKVEVINYTSGACSATPYVEVQIVDRAVSYSVNVLDNGTPIRVLLPPFDDQTAPAGTHRRGLAGYNASGGGCDQAAEGYLARFAVQGAVAKVDTSLPTQDTASPPGAVATVLDLETSNGTRPRAYVERGGRRTSLAADDVLRVGDVIATGERTVLRFERDLGGVATIRPNSRVRIENLGFPSEADPKPRFQLTKGGMWAKCGEMKESLQIQTTGGVMGIKDRSGGPPPPGPPPVVGTVRNVQGPLTVIHPNGQRSRARPGQRVVAGDRFLATEATTATIDVRSHPDVRRGQELIEITNVPGDAVDIRVRGDVQDSTRVRIGR